MDVSENNVSIIDCFTRFDNSYQLITNRSNNNFKQIKYIFLYNMRKFSELAIRNIILQINFIGYLYNLIIINTVE